MAGPGSIILQIILTQFHQFQVVSKSVSYQLIDYHYITPIVSIVSNFLKNPYKSLPVSILLIKKSVMNCL